jgi:hypothetical protein
MTTSLLKELRIEYHKKIFRDIFGLRDGTTVYSNADSTSPASVDLAQGMAEIIGQPDLSSILCKWFFGFHKAGILSSNMIEN